jgi:hypothetical protein
VIDSRRGPNASIQIETAADVLTRPRMKAGLTFNIRLFAVELVHDTSTSLVI